METILFSSFIIDLDIAIVIYYLINQTLRRKFLLILIGPGFSLSPF